VVVVKVVWVNRLFLLKEYLEQVAAAVVVVMLHIPFLVFRVVLLVVPEYLY
jgi:hypothetical protein